ncbi:MAG: zinc-ribbon domain containing protein [Syntrophomonadaceae bacterium]|nr:zinc-ribbon domain containing protein [Syntrophomonadaceae bacterium]
MIEDKFLLCSICNNEFLFSASEQAEKGFEKEHSICPVCRTIGEKQTTEAIRPVNDRQTYCRSCLMRRSR